MDTKIMSRREQLTPVETKTTKRGMKAPTKHLDVLRESVERNLQKRNKKVRRYMQHYKPVKKVEELYQRKNYHYSANGTVAGNYYPVTSAIAVRDHNATQPNATKKSKASNATPSAAQLAKRDLGKKQKQVTIMNDRSQGGSAGLRGGKNIEFMQHRRFRRKDNYGVGEYLNDVDKYGKGIQVQSTYYM